MKSRIINICCILIVFLMIIAIPNQSYCGKKLYGEDRDQGSLYTPTNTSTKSNKSNSTNSTSSTGKKSTKGSSTEVDEYSWVSEAFNATKNFFTDSEVVDEIGVLEPWMIIFTDIVRAVNRVLTILLAGLSIISLSIVGVRYIMSAYKPSAKDQAKKDLHLVFTGMFYGFGAFAIWKIVMSIVKVIIQNF